MPTPILHFAPANGFPGGSYRSLLEPLKTHFPVVTLDRLGHHPSYPVNNNWQNLTHEFLAHLDQQVPGKHLIGVGHSLGGVVTYLAALEQPERFEQLILLDPPLMTGLDSLGLKLAKRLGFIDKVTPAGITRGRRSHWPDQASALAYFQGKKLFQNFHPQALADYVDAGTEADPKGGIKLRFEPKVEVAIFRNLADHLTGSHKKLNLPVTVIRGSETDLITPARAKKLEKMGFNCQQLPGGHMFPLENPEATRKLLLQLIQQPATA
ncbi:Pimeloyl-ACP methyl ester carboxylesterase [Marinospirillum celere]|uniref:Pimeloyl-ACP methyl ester carboxylesterase n=1 Tax=Marinospirillum celere TaxID=1122252 RepID=A0A1I1E6S0_9GAMM|nr:alpha/beta hydrolase [Marinospirillum celere]SFB82352.1 Pimeloyl-ACP methyl ester carboxylesterase [Marinospirillum celere]